MMRLDTLEHASRWMMAVWTSMALAGCGGKTIDPGARGGGPGATGGIAAAGRNGGGAAGQAGGLAGGGGTPAAGSLGGGTGAGGAGVVGGQGGTAGAAGQAGVGGQAGLGVAGGQGGGGGQSGFGGMGGQGLAGSILGLAGILGWAGDFGTGNEGCGSRGVCTMHQDYPGIRFCTRPGEYLPPRCFGPYCIGMMGRCLNGGCVRLCR